VVMKSTNFRDITRISGRRIILFATCLHAGFLLNLFFRPWRWRRYVPPKRRLVFYGLHGVISQKLVLFETSICVWTGLLASAVVSQHCVRIPVIMWKHGLWYHIVCSRNIWNCDFIMKHLN
jgi:hypothetical protein